LFGDYLKLGDAELFESFAYLHARYSMLFEA